MSDIEEKLDSKKGFKIGSDGWYNNILHGWCSIYYTQVRGSGR